MKINITVLSFREMSFSNFQCKAEESLIAIKTARPLKASFKLKHNQTSAATKPSLPPTLPMLKAVELSTVKVNHSIPSHQN